MEAALLIAVVIQAVVIAFLAGSLPFLWWKAFHLSARVSAQKRDIAMLDEALASLLGTVGIHPEVTANGQPTGRNRITRK